MNKESVAVNMRKEVRRFKAVFALEKDLQENEVVCAHCHGTGIEIAENIYGLVGDTTQIGLHFPYKNPSLTFCKYCWNGVQRKCPHCGSIRGKADRACPCGIGEENKREECKKIANELWEKAKKIPIKEAWEKYKVLYIETIEEFVYSEEELYEIIEEYELDETALRIYATTVEKISISAENVIENACENLYESAEENCDVESLQAVLDAWCEKQTGTTSYSPDYSIGIVVEKEQC